MHTAPSPGTHPHQGTVSIDPQNASHRRGNALPDEVFAEDGCLRVADAIRYLVEKNVALGGTRR